MPNWCSNKLSIYGKEEDLMNFKKLARGKSTDMSLNNFVPMPKELEDTVFPGDDPNWYDWRIQNWGTKWDVEAHIVEESDDRLIYEFESAWSPPTYWLKKVAPMFPEITFELYFKEPGMCFQGAMSAKGDFSIHQEEDYYEDLGEWEEDDDIESKL